MIVRRWACCDVMFNATDQPVCEFCDKPMIPAHKYPDPTSIGYAHPMITPGTSTRP
jgi:hypothetical protein